MNKYNKQKNSSGKSSTGFYGNNNRRRRFRRNDRRSGRKPNKSFNPRLVVGESKNVNQPAQKPYIVVNKFTDFSLEPDLTNNILNRNYVEPTPIQDRAIPEIMAGRDVVGVANTGTGKTAAFLIPLINKVMINGNSKVLIIAPTRELALQIEKEFFSFTKGLHVYSTACIGGASINAQVKKLQRNPQFVIGTPGRLLDLANRRKINFGRFDSIVLDEVDHMLDMGFIHDINKIITELPENRQSLFFTATLDKKVESVMSKFIHDPVKITVKTSDIRTNIHQDLVELRGREKITVLSEILDKEEVTKVLIFTRTKRGADKLYKGLSNRGFHSTVLHGDKRQSQRRKSLDKFRNGNVNIMIATDVASRGIDVDDISHVINHDLPETYDDYIHRIGRTGRVNKEGIALTFVA